MTDYILEISCSADVEDVVQGRLYLTPSIGADTSDDGVIRAYFQTAAERDDAAEALRDLPVVLRRDERPHVDWLQLYQQSLQPIFIGRSFVVAPEAALIPGTTERHALTIPQESAYGTGSHESTALAIELLEEMNLQGKTALDIGSGSGILALAMRRLGARKVIAFDNDLHAYAPLRQNRIRNGIDGVALFIGTLDALRGGRFDLITMNILPEVIVPLLPEVTAHMAGVLILSGILMSQRDDILAAAAGLRLVSERARGEWWAATLVGALAASPAGPPAAVPAA